MRSEKIGDLTMKCFTTSVKCCRFFTISYLIILSNLESELEFCKKSCFFICINFARRRFFGNLQVTYRESFAISAKVFFPIGSEDCIKALLTIKLDASQISKITLNTVLTHFCFILSARKKTVSLETKLSGLKQN